MYLNPHATTNSTFIGHELDLRQEVSARCSMTLWYGMTGAQTSSLRETLSYDAKTCDLLMNPVWVRFAVAQGPYGLQNGRHPFPIKPCHVAPGGSHAQGSISHRVSPLQPARRQYDQSSHHLLRILLGTGITPAGVCWCCRGVAIIHAKNATPVLLGEYDLSGQAILKRFGIEKKRPSGTWGPLWSVCKRFAIGLILLIGQFVSVVRFGIRFRWSLSQIRPP